MKVRELLEKLQDLDPDMEVLCYMEDEDLTSGNAGSLILDVQSVQESVGERLRDVHRKPGIRFGESATSERFALLEVTAVF